jgi:hypothetical protein
MKHAREDYDRIQDPAGLIPADEPVFLIRGKDMVGPSAVESWAYFAESSGASEHIVAAARAQAERMRAWQQKNGLKLPDMPKSAAVKDSAYSKAFASFPDDYEVN